MAGILQWIVQAGEWLGRWVPFLPDYPFKEEMLLAVATSMAIGGVISLCLLSSDLTREPDRAVRLAKGDELAKKGKFAAARKVYLEAKQPSRAAQMAMRMDRKEEAAELALRGGDYAFAGQIYAQLGRPQEAAEAFDKGRRPQESADQWEAAGKLEIALERARAAGNASKVVCLLARLERHEEMGDLLQAEYMREKMKLGANPPIPAVEKIRELATRAGESFRKAGMLKKAAQIYLQAELTAQAAECFERSGELVKASDLYQQAEKPEKAADLLVKAGRFELAADLYEEIGKPDEIPRLLKMAGKEEEAQLFAGRLALERGDDAKAADLMAQGGDRIRAAEMFSSLGSTLRAAELWEAEGMFGDAASAYDTAGEKGKAAPLYVRIGRHLQAGRCYEQAGMLEEAMKQYEAAGKFYDAARISELLEGIDQAISLFQRVPPDSDESARARSSLGRLFWKKGLLDLAAEKFKEVCSGQSVTQKNIGLFYDYATFLEETGKLDAANGLYENLLSIDFNYKDVLARKKGVEEKRKARPTKAPPAPEVKASEAAQPTDGPARPLGLLEPGRVISERYELTREIGRGGMGIIFQGRDRKLGRDVALKFLPPQLSGSVESEEKFRREAQVAAQLSHRNIVATYDFGKHHQGLFLAMEYIDGPNLREVLDQKQTYFPKEACEAGLQIADALAYAHGRQVVHRDIKSANLLVAQGSTIKIADFGLARVIRESEKHATRTLGSPLYMAPEQILGEGIDHRVDLYAFGIVLYELLSGQPPFVEGEVTYHHLHTPPLPITEVASGVNEDFGTIVMKLIEKKPENRYATAEEVQMLLEMLVF